jgi:signal transduction histidine kinase
VTFGGGLLSVWRETGQAGRDEYRKTLLSRTVILRVDGSYLFAGFFPRGDFSIRCFMAMEDYASSGVSGVLEITRDVSAEYRQIAAMQYAALAIAVGVTIFLTFVLRLVVARGEAIIHQRNAEKAALNERLNQAERLVNLGRMVATVSHEIRNPLGIINSSADYLSRRLAGDPKLARLSGAIVDESTRLSRIVTDFLDFARPQKPRMGPVVVEDILEEIMILLEVDMSRAGVELRTGLREDPGFILADGILLHRAFMNILVNAIQAMTEGGLLTVETALEGKGADAPGPADPEADASIGPARLRIRVTDTGPGITQDALDNLYKPFFTTKTKGTGLGLVLVRNIVEGHGGRLVLRNVEGGEEGHGLEVTITIPLDGGGAPVEAS